MKKQTIVSILESLSNEGLFSAMSLAKKEKYNGNGLSNSDYANWVVYSLREYDSRYHRTNGLIKAHWDEFMRLEKIRQSSVSSSKVRSDGVMASIPGSKSGPGKETKPNIARVKSSHTSTNRPKKSTSRLTSRGTGTNKKHKTAKPWENELLKDSLASLYDDVVSSVALLQDPETRAAIFKFLEEVCAKACSSAYSRASKLAKDAIARSPTLFAVWEILKILKALPHLGLSVGQLGFIVLQGLAIQLKFIEFLCSARDSTRDFGRATSHAGPKMKEVLLHVYDNLGEPRLTTASRELAINFGSWFGERLLEFITTEPTQAIATPPPSTMSTTITIAPGSGSGSAALAPLQAIQANNSCRRATRPRYEAFARNYVPVHGHKRSSSNANVRDYSSVAAEKRSKGPGRNTSRVVTTGAQPERTSVFPIAGAKRRVDEVEEFEEPAPKKNRGPERGTKRKAEDDVVEEGREVKRTRKDFGEFDMRDAE